MKRLYQVLEIILLVLIIGVFTWGTLNYSMLELIINEQIKTYGYLAIFAISVILEIVPQYLSPHLGILSAKLFEFNLLYATILVIFGSFLGSIVGYEIGIGARDKSNLQENLIGKERYYQVKKVLNEKGKFAITLAAITPLPYMPIIWGILSINRKTFFLYGIIPRTIGCVLFALGINYIF